MSKTSMFPISDLVFQFASFGFPNMKLALQNKQIGIPNWNWKYRSFGHYNKNNIESRCIHHNDADKKIEGKPPFCCLAPNSMYSKSFYVVDIEGLWLTF